MKKEDLWDELCKILMHHKQGDDDCLSTMNRLVPALEHEQLPTLTKENVKLTIEKREKGELFRLGLTP